jgi:general secretion pathway protein D
MNSCSLRGHLVFAFVLLLAAALELSAQQRNPTGGRPAGVNRTTGGANRGVGGSSLGGSAGSRQYNPSGTIGEALISADPETRRIIVITDEETSQYVSQVITNLDRPKPQVLIKVVFMEVSYRNTLDVGVEGGAKHNADGAQGAGASSFGLSGLNSAATGQVLNSLGMPVQSLAPTPPGAGLYQILGTDFQATLRAIAQAGKTEILSRPSILTRNSQQATISLGQEVPLVTNTRFDTLGNQINTVSYQSVGIILRVTPFISDDDKVEMIVSPETSELADRSQWVPVANGVTAPVINSRVADTVVVVPNGQTAVIGGLMSKSKVSSDSKIPILGDIPLLGTLFKRKLKDDAKTELIIFLTPTIVRDSTQLAQATDSERDKTKAQNKTFTEEELNTFLEGLPYKGPPEKRKDEKSKRSSIPE